MGDDEVVVRGDLIQFIPVQMTVVINEAVVKPVAENPSPLRHLFGPVCQPLQHLFNGGVGRGGAVGMVHAQAEKGEMIMGFNEPGHNGFAFQINLFSRGSSPGPDLIFGSRNGEPVAKYPERPG